MVDSADSTCEADEYCGHEVSDPHLYASQNSDASVRALYAYTEPGVPPSETTAGNHARGDHPSVDIERVGDPEALR